MLRFLKLSLLSTALASCSLAPNYQRPEMAIPEYYKEAPKAKKQWAKAKACLPTKLTPWWEAFKDPTLNKLEEQLAPTNQDLKAIYFRYEQASALAQVARADLVPTLLGIGNVSRQRSSASAISPTVPLTFNNFLLGAMVNYEVDVWGSIRNNVAQKTSLAKASESDIVALSLSLQAELASDYFTLRGYDESQRILDRTVSAYKQALFLTQQRFKQGASPEEDVDNAKTQYENARTMAADMHLKRDQMEHAIAILLGKVPANFSLSTAKLPKKIIEVSPNLPSSLLERRPDIVSAELKVMAANANIGVARAAFFPTFDLVSSVGDQSKKLANLLSKPSLFWALGPTSTLALAQPTAQITLFDGGRLLSSLKQAKANYFETVAAYRQTVLTAFREVEDNLVAMKQLDLENRTQALATRAAKKALRQAVNRYKGGIATFLDIIVTENTALQTELAQVNILTRRQVASIQLVKALGGSWAGEKKQK